MAVKIVHADIGDRLTPQATFTVAGSATDPTQIVVKQQDPAGVETTVTTASSPGTLTTASTPLARMSAGVFKLSPGISASLAGHWFFRFEATGTAESAEDFQYDVDPSEFYAAATLSSRALVNLPEAKDWLQVQNVQTDNDLELARVINDISELAHSEAGREFKRVDTTSSATVRVFPIDTLGFNRYVQIDDLSAAPTLVRIMASDWVTPVATVSTSEYTVYPLTREPWAPITAIQLASTVIRPQYGQRLEVTGVWGFPAIPGDLRQAVLDEVANVMNRDVEHYAQDLSPVTAGAGQNVVVFGGRPSFLPANPKSLSIFRRYRNPLLG
jgi:hypothetical protein